MSWSPIGRPIRVGAFEHDPDAFNCFRSVPRRRCEKPGAEIEIISMVMKLLDWQWEVIDTESHFNIVNDFGSQRADGNFSGMMGLLASDKIDMSGLSMRITPERMQFAHFTFPIRYFQQVYIIRRPPDHSSRNFIFAPFTTDLWIILLGTMLAVSTVRFLCAMCWERRVGLKCNICSRSLLETFGLMMNQRVLDPSAISTMILEGFLMISMLSVTQYYQTIMNSLLTAPPSSHIPFYHQEQLAELLLHKKTFLTYYFNYTPEGSSVRNERLIDEAMIVNPVVVRDKEIDLIREIHRGGVFYSTYDIAFLPSTVSVWDKAQGLTVIRDTTGIISYVAFGFSVSNRKLCQMFNKQLLKILPGVATITHGPGYATRKQAEDTTVQVKKTELTLRNHLAQLFYIYTIGSGLSVVLFVIEMIYYRVAAIRNIKIYQVNRCDSDATI